MGLVKLLSDSFRFFGQNLGQIVTLCLPFIVASILVAQVPAVLWRLGFVGPMTLVPPYSPWIADLFFYPIYTGALIVLMARRTGGQSPRNGELLTAALSLWWPLFLLNLIVTVLIVVGLLLFIVPGIWLAVRLVFSKFLLVLDHLGPMDAMRRSLTLTRSRFWLILKCMYVVIASILLLNVVVALVVAQLGSGLVVTIAVSAVLGLCMLYLTVVMFRIFLLAREEGEDAEGSHA